MAQLPVLIKITRKSDFFPAANIGPSAKKAYVDNNTCPCCRISFTGNSKTKPGQNLTLAPEYPFFQQNTIL